MGRSRKKIKIVINSSLDTKKKNTDSIPTDIVNEILQRLPAKSVAKFVRVSKSWASMIRSNYIINFLSMARQQKQPHRLLLASYKIKDECTWNFFHLNDEKPLEFISSIVTKLNGRFDRPIYVNGLLSFICGKNTQIISNPSNGKSIVLPLVESKREIVSRFFGFDPIKGEYKVLCITKSIYGSSGCCAPISPFQNQILTVGPNGLWREIDEWIPHRPYDSKGVCIDGVIYYLAHETGSLQLILVRFDVRSEKFLKDLPCLFLQPFGRSLTLINYKSKLAIADERTRSFDLWVLEDVKSVEWLKISHDVNRLRCLNSSFDIKIVGTSPSGEIIYTCYGQPNENFYVIYYDHKKNQHIRDLIRGYNKSTSYILE